MPVKCTGEEVGGGVSGDAFHGNASTDVPPTVTPEDIARGWQLWKVRTNCNISYTMPEETLDFVKLQTECDERQILL